MMSLSMDNNQVYRIERINAVLESDTLIFSGYGDMVNFGVWTDQPPWRSVKGIKKVMIESGITSIGEYAFYSMAELESIILPDSVKDIGKHAFEKCIRLKSIKIPDSVSCIRSSTFANCKALTSVEFPQSLYRIYRWAFRDCISLRNVEFPSSLSIISSTAFYGIDLRTENLLKASSRFCVKNNCLYDQKTNMVIMGNAQFEITVPYGAASIEEYAFYKNPQIKIVRLPATISKIKKYAFAENPNLETVIIPTKAFCDENVFYHSPLCIPCFGEKGYDNGYVKKMKTPVDRLGCIASTRSSVVSSAGEWAIASIGTGCAPDFDIGLFYTFAPFDSVAAGRAAVYSLKGGQVVIWGDETELNGNEYFHSTSTRLANELKHLCYVKSIAADEGTVACVLENGTMWSNIPDNNTWKRWSGIIQAGATWKEVYALCLDGRIRTTCEFVEKSIQNWDDIIQFDVWGPYYCNPCLVGLRKNGTVRISINGKEIEDSAVAAWKNMIQVSCCNRKVVALNADGSVYRYKNGESERITDYKNVLAVRSQFDYDFILQTDGTIVRF